MLKIFSKKFDKNYHLDVKKTHISCIRGDFFFSHSAAWKMQKCIRCMQSCSHAVCVRKKNRPVGATFVWHVLCLSVFLSFLFLLLNSLNSFDLLVYVSDFWNNLKGLKWSPFLRGFCGWRWCSIQIVYLFENVRIKVFIKVLTALQVDGVCPRHLQRCAFLPARPVLPMRWT